MYTEKSKKRFVKPECNIVTFELNDIITTSGGDDWGMGEIPLTIEEVQKPWSMGETD